MRHPFSKAVRTFHILILAAVAVSITAAGPAKSDPKVAKAEAASTSSVYTMTWDKSTPLDYARYTWISLAAVGPDEKLLQVWTPPCTDHSFGPAGIRINDGVYVEGLKPRTWTEPPPIVVDGAVHTDCTNAVPIKLNSQVLHWWTYEWKKPAASGRDYPPRQYFGIRKDTRYVKVEVPEFLTAGSPDGDATFKADSATFEVDTETLPGGKPAIVRVVYRRSTKGPAVTTTITTDPSFRYLPYEDLRRVNPNTWEGVGTLWEEEVGEVSGNFHFGKYIWFKIIAVDASGRWLPVVPPGCMPGEKFERKNYYIVSAEEPDKNPDLVVYEGGLELACSTSVPIKVMDHEVYWNVQNKAWAVQMTANGWSVGQYFGVKKCECPGVIRIEMPDTVQIETGPPTGAGFISTAEYKAVSSGFALLPESFKDHELVTVRVVYQPVEPKAASK